MISRKAIVIAAIGLAGVAIFSVTALASTGAGFMGTPQVRGTLSGAVHINTDRIKFQTKNDGADVVVQTTTYAPAGYSGWHTHPGFVLVVVESGAVTLQVGCSIHTYSAGPPADAFYESGTTPIMARNLGTVPAVVRITYVVPKGSPVRIEVPASQAPVCN
ncbi:MAG: cupin domain-containing protein [Chloroflexi bacterium]|nr:MAG: cupin domain-containing protein [Chloroflexota bacterium]